MKTSAMIAMLEKNPNLRFKRPTWDSDTSIGIKDDAIQMLTKTGEVWTYSGSKSNTDRFVAACLQIGVGGGWELIQEPVAWQEAMQAWAEGKTVRCVFENQQGAIYVFKSFHAKAETSTNLSRDMITKGTWYIDE
jgi:hypothetical protein